MTTFAEDERQALCDTLLRTGPDAPTLCEGWTTRDLAAHLVLRERRPDAQLAAHVPFLTRHAVAVGGQVRDADWATLVASVRSGPPVWSPARLRRVDEALNTAELFVHHEDVIRAQPDWTPRPLPDGLQAALWGNLRLGARLVLRRAPVGVELVAPDHGRVVAHSGSPTVRVEGPPSEVMLFAFGRRDHAQVRLDGPDDAIARLQESRLGP